MSLEFVNKVDISGTLFNPGWRANTNDQYHDGSGIGSSMLKDFGEFPAKFYWKHVLGNARKETKALRIGQIIHQAVLEPRKFLASYIAIPDFGDQRKTENKNAKAAYMAGIPEGVTIITEDERQMLIDMADSILGNSYAADLLKGGVAERSGYWVDEKTGLLLRCRPDFHRSGHGTTVDLKTCRSSKPSIFGKDAYGYGYQISAAQYIDGIEKIDGTKTDEYVYLTIEKEPPYPVDVYVETDEMLKIGRSQFRSYLDGIRVCLDAHKKLLTANTTEAKAFYAAWPNTRNPSRKYEPMNMTSPQWALYENGVSL